MPSRIYCLTIDCAEPAKLAQFWSAALDYKIVFESEDEVAIEDPQGKESTILLLKSPAAKTTKNRLHIDLNPSDQTAEVERLVGLGASHADIGQHADEDVTWIVLADPEGNEFCVLTPKEQ